jgi:ABC-type polysaccharide/polyol phosphate transport system ATPase subunit
MDRPARPGPVKHFCTSDAEMEAAKAHRLPRSSHSVGVQRASPVDRRQPYGQTNSAERLLEVNNIEVVYNDIIQVLRGVSLMCAQGGIVALLGTNGAGKTTTLRAISGLLKPENGFIRTAISNSMDTTSPMSWAPRWSNLAP